eukprot:Nk52_evm9s215 gene=Nk52_evmTU9s215
MGEDAKYLESAKFRAYQGAVDKLLKSFETSREWADLISCLGRLNRLLSTYSQFPVIPHAIIVTKRLAQCLNPALPSGVHLKALETYESILSRIGPERLARNLLVYTYGIFPLFQYASIAVKPLMLEIYEKYFVPLKKNLRPCLKAFILAVLPGLEEGSEHYQRCVNILSQTCVHVGEPLFYSSLWQCMGSSSQCRLQVLSFIMYKLSKRESSVEESVFIVGQDINIAINGLSSGLADSNLLVQRGALDLLGNFFQLHTNILNFTQFCTLLRTAVFVVLRRDMSLNRRLYSWLLGSDKVHSSSLPSSRRGSIAEEKNGMQEKEVAALKRMSTADEGGMLEKSRMEYFEKFSRSVLKSALKQEFYKSHKDSSEGVKIYKVLISLLDKPEIGQPMVCDLLPHIMHSLLYHSIQTTNVDPKENVRAKTAKLFLRMLDPDTVWKLLGELTKVSSTTNASFLKSENEPELPDIKPIDLADFTLEFNDIENDIGTQVSEVPKLLCDVLRDLLLNLEDSPIEVVQGLLRFTRKSLGKILPSYVGSEKSPDYLLSNEVNDRRASIMSNLSGHSEENEPISNSSGIKAETVFEKASPIRLCLLIFLDLFGALVEKYGTSGGNTEIASHGLILRDACMLLIDFACFPIESTSTFEKEQSDPLSPWLNALLKCFSSSSNGIFLSALNAFLDLVNLNQHFLLNGSLAESKSNCSAVMFSSMLSRPEFEFVCDNPNYLHTAALRLWELLSFEDRDVQMQSVVLMVRLHEVTPFHVLEGIVSRDIVAPCKDKKSVAFKRFTLFWQLSAEVYENTHMPRSRQFSAPLFMMLENLKTHDPTLLFLARCFLNECLKALPRFMDPFFLVLMMSSSERNVPVSNSKHLTPLYDQAYDTSQVLYVLNLILQCLECEGEHFVSALIQSRLKSSDVISLNRRHERSFEGLGNNIFDGIQVGSYFHLLILRLLRFIQTETDTTARLAVIRQSNKEVQALSAVVLAKLLSFIQVDKVDDATFPIKMLKLLSSQGDFVKYLRAIESVSLDKLSHAVSVGNEILQVRILEILRYLIIVADCECNLSMTKNEGNDNAKKPNRLTLTITSSPLFLVTILSALENEKFQQSHPYWIQFVARSLPYMKGMVKNLVVSVVICICGLLKRVPFDNSDKNSASSNLPSYTISIAAGLLEIIEFSLRDTPVESEVVKDHDRVSEFMSLFSSSTSVVAEEKIASTCEETKAGVLSVIPNILEALVCVWGDVSLGSLAPRKRKKKSSSNLKERSELSLLQQPTSSEAIGTRYVYHEQRKVRELITAIITPFFKKCGVQLLGGISMVWYRANKDEGLEVSIPGRRRSSSAQDISLLLPEVDCGDVEWKRRTLCAGRSEQLRLLDTFISMEGLTPHRILKIVHKIFSQLVDYNAASSIRKHTNDLREIFPEQGLFQFFYAYLDTCSKTSLFAGMWVDLMSVVKDVIQKSTCPHTILLVLGILDVYSLRAAKLGFFADRKQRKEFQDIMQKVIEACVAVVGNGMKAVKTYKPMKEGVGVEGRLTNSADKKKKSESILLIEYMYDSITVFGKILLPLLDRVFTIDEKDRIPSLLVSLVGNISIILRNKSAHNKISCSRSFAFLHALSKYTYCFRCWKREVWDLFLDPLFFKNEDPKNCDLFRMTLKRLLGYDKSIFADIVGKASMTPSNSLNLFTSREQEYEHMAAMLRRLAFCVYAADVDHYEKQLPQLQERISECFKLPEGDVVYREAFLFMRVILLRFSHHHLTSLWPVIISEMVKVYSEFIGKYSFLAVDDDEGSKGAVGGKHRNVPVQIVTNTDVNGVDAKESWAHLLLSVCKLLDLLLILPVEYFEQSKWGFVSEIQFVGEAFGAKDEDGIVEQSINGNIDIEERSKENIEGCFYVPYVDTLCDTTCPDESTRAEAKEQGMRYYCNLNRIALTRPFIEISKISSVDELQTFFAGITSRVHVYSVVNCSPDMDYINEWIMRDFCA